MEDKIDAEALCVALEGAANFMRGMALDLRLFRDGKEALLSKASKIDELTNRYVEEQELS